MPLTIRRVLLIDGTGAKLERATVVVDGDRIVAVGPDSRVKIPRGSRVIEGQGRALLPGLIDCHVHYCLDAGPDVIRTLEQDDPTVTAIKAVTHARATLEAGITTVRDVGSRDHISIRSPSTTTVARSSLAPVPSISSTRRIASGMGLDSERGLNLADVAVHFHLAEERLELAGLVDNERAPLDAPVGLSVHVLLLVDPVGLRDLTVLIAQQGEGEAVFLDELLMGLGVVHADAQHDGVSLLDRAQGVPKAARFLGEPRRVVLGVEVEHHLFAFEALQADRLAVLVG